MTERFIAGLVGPPFGLKGFVKVRTFSGETEHLARLDRICLRTGGAEKLYTLEAAVPAGASPGMLLLKFAGIDSPEAAKTLGGAEIIVSRADAAPLKPGEFYVEDLKGLEVAVAAENSAGSCGETWELVGHIAGILEAGGGELLELRLLSGELRLVPFRNEFFGEVSLEKSRIILLERWILE
ncbi:MAG: ribosome maturation factor RimM [Treponema sp.]|nr:ribosome maturation factor RimM [Treponema sp.]